MPLIQRLSTQSAGLASSPVLPDSFSVLLQPNSNCVLHSVVACYDDQDERNQQQGVGLEESHLTLDSFAPQSATTSSEHSTQAASASNSNVAGWLIDSGR